MGAAAAIAVNWLLLLPLPQVIGAVTDAIDADMLSAMTRLGAVAISAVGIVIGGAATFALGEALSMDHPGLSDLPTPPWYLVLVFRHVLHPAHSNSRRRRPGPLALRGRAVVVGSSVDF